VRPLVVGPHFTLWPLENHHIQQLHMIITDPLVRDSWRTRGRYWAPFQLQAQLASDSLCSAVATTGDSGAEVIGLVELLDADLLDRRAHMSLVVGRQHLSSGVGIQMAGLFAEFAFGAFDLEKLYLEVQGNNDRLVPGLQRLLDHEATFKRHLNINGDWRDIEVFALWPERLPDLLRRCVRSQPESEA
ncbi:MAG: GNAT family N-acetyltransferase, partial [Acidimicrobiales bacterium]